jgi:hypothetical protein
MTRIHPLAVAFFLLAGCEPLDDEEGTLGDKGRVAFQYRQGCFFGCPIGQPLLAGSHQTIEVSDPGDVEGASVRSSDDAIAEFALERECFCERDEDDDGRIPIALDADCERPRHKRCHNQILVLGHGDGDAVLELLDATDHVLDSIRVLVREPASAEFSASFPDVLGSVRGTEFDLAVDERVGFQVALHDEQGRELLASDGVTWSVGDPEMATLSGFLIASSDRIEDGVEVTVEALSPGETPLTVETAGFEDAVTLRVAE